MKKVGPRDVTVSRCGERNSECMRPPRRIRWITKRGWLWEIGGGAGGRRSWCSLAVPRRLFWYMYPIAIWVRSAVELCMCKTSAGKLTTTSSELRISSFYLNLGTRLASRPLPLVLLQQTCSALPCCFFWLVSKNDFLSQLRRTSSLLCCQCSLPFCPVLHEAFGSVSLNSKVICNFWQRLLLQYLARR